MNVITNKQERDSHLRTKNRFYQTGWLDADRDEPAQASTREQDEKFYQDYLDGYNDAMSNYYTLQGQANEK